MLEEFYGVLLGLQGEDIPDAPVLYPFHTVTCFTLSMYVICRIYCEYATNSNYQPPKTEDGSTAGVLSTAVSAKEFSLYPNASM